ncbi:conserved hypothetical protein [Syntrophobacter sp. SbD1]|nr:conserved hypothetical protein [Syntrophobacter sp. SbD1]
MPGPFSARRIDELSSDELVVMAIEGFRRTLVHYGLWFREVERKIGIEKAMEIEAEAGDRLTGILFERLSAVFGFQLEGGLPKRLKEMSRDELLGLIEVNAKNWLAQDGVWFRAMEKRHGMADAKECNDLCWSHFSPYEAMRIKILLGLPESPGLDGLKKALAFRMYSSLNIQSIHQADEGSLIFQMNDCRVQSTRKRKGLADYPCKSAGIVEYPTFATAIDPRIRTECVGCPPDEHPPEWYCAWKFTLEAK